MPYNIIVKKILEVSILDNLSLIENGINFKEIAEKIYKTVCNVACEILKEVRDYLDRMRDTKALRNKGVKHTFIKTILGYLESDIRIYKFKIKDGKSDYKFLLDESLQFYR